MRDIKRHSSLVGTIRRAIGKIQEHRLLNSLERLPQIADAIAADIATKAKRFYVLRQEQLAYLRQVNDAMKKLPSSDQPKALDFSTLLQRLQAGSDQESWQAHDALLDRFSTWSDDAIGYNLTQEARQDHQLFRQESFFNLIGCNYIYTHLHIISQAMGRRVNHLNHTLTVYKEVILLSRDLMSARKGLGEVARTGERVYQTVGESCSRLEVMMEELHHPHLIFGSQHTYL